MSTRIFDSIKTQFYFLNYDLFYDHMYRFFSFFWSFVCFYTFSVFGLLSRHIFRYEESESLVKFADDDQSKAENSAAMETAVSARSKRYEFLSVKDISGVVEEPKTLSVTIHELFVNSINSDPEMDTALFDTGGESVDDLQETERTENSVLSSEEEEEEYNDFDSEKTDDSVKFFGSEDDLENPEMDTPIFDSGGKSIDELLETEKTEISVSSSAGEKEEDNDFDVEKTEDSVKSYVSEEDLKKPEMETFTNEIDDLDSLDKVEFLLEEESVCSNDVFLEKIDKIDSSTRFVDQGSDSDDEYIELQPHKKNNSMLFDEEKQEQNESVDQKASKNESQYDTDYMVEHEDIVEQLKLELKLARTGGLPTILEESESEELVTPKTVQQLKPMKIDDDQIFDYKLFFEGIQKVYRNYADKMRKLDILNFQTMHAVGLLEMKGTVELETSRKSKVTGIMSILSQNLRLCKGREVIDPMKRIIADMHRDFDTIYTGQLCLSWEILHWQYWKVKELQNYESQGCHQYNQVAGEFQLFQVLIHRFLEDEQFQGPTRIQNYVKNRCVLRSHLQVPLLKDDSSKDKGKTRHDNEESAITSQKLADIIEESIKVFWEFLRTDKDESNTIFQSHMQYHSNLQVTADLELLTDIRTDFQKKEKRLKDILRSGNCIVKRLKKKEENGMHESLLIAQVELKLIARVLNMSKLTTDKLIWCHEKLDRINFCNRQVYVESSFLLFPC